MENELHAKLQSLEFFADADLIIERIQKQDKCFLAIDQNTGKKYKVRTNNPKSPGNADNEFCAYQLLNGTPAMDALPKLLYYDADAGICVTEWVDGDALNKSGKYDDETICHIYRGILNAVGKLHAVRATMADNPAQAQFANWTEFFRHKLNDTMNHVPYEFFGEQLRQKIWRLFDDNADYFANVQTCYIHGDLRCHNVVYNPTNRRVYLIDFESVMVGDPNFDLLRILCDRQLAVATGGREIAEQNPIYILYYLEMMMYWFGHTYEKYGIVEQTAIDAWNRLLG